MEVVEKAHRAGVPMAFGTDLIGRMHRMQNEEFELRADLVPAADLIRSATVTGASLIRREGDLGQVKSGFQGRPDRARRQSARRHPSLARPESRI